MFPNFGTQLATLWLMIIVALTWDMTGGQMGYNSLGNIFFYGTGMYVAAVVVRSGMVYDVGELHLRGTVAVSISFTDLSNTLPVLFLGILGGRRVLFAHCGRYRFP